MPAFRFKNDKYCGMCGHRTSLRNCKIHHKRVEFEDVACDEYDDTRFKTGSTPSALTTSSKQIEAVHQNKAGELNMVKIDELTNESYAPKPEALVNKTCGDCVFKPMRGAGGCRNPENDIKKSKQKKQVVYDTPICQNFKLPGNVIKSPTQKDDEDEKIIIETATAILKEYPIITLRDNIKEMYYYKGGVYIYGAEAQIREIAQALLGEDTNKQLIGEIVFYIQNATFIDREKINKDKKHINVKNGLYDIGTHELKPHSSEIISTCQIPVNYEPTATCPEIANFLCEILRPRDIPLVLQEIGYCLIPDYSIQKAFLWNGSGLNGKGTLGRLIVKLIGDKNKSTQSLKALNTDKFSASNLYGKSVNIDMDLTDESITEDTMFKKLTGGDMISGERKFQDCFEFTNLARLIFGCNDIPHHIKGGDYAYFRRWILTDFPCKFDGKLEDKDLDSKLQTDTELSGFLNVCLQALEWLLKTKTFFYDKTPEQVGEEYLLKSNSVLAFINECTIPADDYVRTADLYRAYQIWGNVLKIRKIEKQNIFGKLLKQAGYTQIRPYEKEDEITKQIPSYDGLQINYEKLAELEKQAGIEKTALLNNKTTLLNDKSISAYTHWYTKEHNLSRVSRDNLLSNIVLNCIESDKITDNDIINVLGLNRENALLTLLKTGDEPGKPEGEALEGKSRVENPEPCLSEQIKDYLIKTYNSKPEKYTINEVSYSIRQNFKTLNTEQIQGFAQDYCKVRSW